MSEPRVLIVHDYLIQRGGAERVVDALLDIYPDAMLATSVISDDYRRHHDGRRITTTFLQRVPGAEPRPSGPCCRCIRRPSSRMTLQGVDLIVVHAAAAG